jgi:deazaflavin-dependent oxidoreductase (nitroreductase family)
MLLVRLVRLLTRPRWLTTRFTRLHAAALRAAGGRIRRSYVFAAGQPVLSLTTVGRRTGLARSTALAYFREGSALVVTASNLGSERDPQWSRNLEANPTATVVLDGKRRDVRARRVTGQEAERLWTKWVELQPAAESFRRVAGRPIPVFILKPESVREARSSPGVTNPAQRLR